MNSKFLLFFVASIAAVLAIEKLSMDEEDKIIENYFRNFPNTRSRRSSTPEQVKENILKHFYEIQEHNERFRLGEETFEMELNELSAVSDEHLAATRLGFIDQYMDSTAAENETLLSSKDSLPSYWNWAERGIVQPVQDQGSCGSCYAFAAIAVIECSMCLHMKKCQKLSEQEAMECTNGCNGGWDHWVYSYAYSSGGCTSSSYRYLGQVRNECRPESRPRVMASKSYSYNVLPNNAEYIREYLYKNGPLFVAFDVYSNLFSYRSGILTTISGSRAGGHAVLLVGYGTSNGTPYWILKNSWGSRWGERGYFRVIRGVDYARIESWKVSFAWTK